MTALLYPIPGYDVQGKSVLGEPEKIGIAPIRMESSLQQTTIRTDKSGSKNRATENIFQGRILVHPKHTIEQGQVVEIYGALYRVDSVWPRLEMNGVLHHWQVDLSIWQE